MYISILIKLLVAMIGVLFFMRLAGKTQMGMITPLDTVNSFIIGALIGGVIYNPGLSVWLRNEMDKLGFSDIKKLFCVEWTPQRGFYIVEMDGKIHDKTKKTMPNELDRDDSV